MQPIHIPFVNMPNLIVSVGPHNQPVVANSYLQAWAIDVTNALNTTRTLLTDIHDFHMWVKQHHPELLVAYTSYIEMRDKVSPRQG